MWQGPRYRSTAVGVAAIGTAVLLALQASRALVDRARNADDANRSMRRAVRCRREQGPASITANGIVHGTRGER